MDRAIKDTNANEIVDEAVQRLHLFSEWLRVAAENCIEDETSCRLFVEASDRFYEDLSQLLFSLYTAQLQSASNDRASDVALAS